MHQKLMSCGRKFLILSDKCSDQCSRFLLVGGHCFQLPEFNRSSQAKRLIIHTYIITIFASELALVKSKVSTHFLDEQIVDSCIVELGSSTLLLSMETEEQSCPKIEVKKIDIGK